MSSIILLNGCSIFLFVFGGGSVLGSSYFKLLCFFAMLFSVFEF